VIYGIEGPEYIEIYLSRIPPLNVVKTNSLD